MTLEEKIHVLLELEMDFQEGKFQEGERAKQAEAARQVIKDHIGGMVDKWSPKTTPA